VSALENGEVKVSLEITNKGKVEGAEVVQLYVKDLESSVPRPLKELKAFKKINLNPGEKRMISLALDKRAFAFFDEMQDDWVIEPGQFEFQIGASSADIRQYVSFNYK